MQLVGLLSCVACMVATEANKNGLGLAAELSLKRRYDECLQGKSQACHQLAGSGQAKCMKCCFQSRPLAWMRIS